MVFHTLNGDFEAPPFHVHCRSIVRPWQPGYISKAREEANAELQRRPMKQRRIGPDGPGGQLPPPTPDNPPQGGPPKPSPLELERQKRITEMRAELDRLMDDSSQWREMDWEEFENAEPGYGRQSPAVMLYTSDWYTDINGMARSGVDGIVPSKMGTEAAADYLRLSKAAMAEAGFKPGIGQTFKVSDLVSSVDRAIANGPTMTQNTVLYRGIRATADYDPASLFKPGGYVVDGGFMSTARERRIAESMFAQADESLTGWVVQVRVPAGTKYVTGSSEIEEVVLGRNSRQKVISVNESAKEIIVEVEHG